MRALSSLSRPPPSGSGSPASAFLEVTSSTAPSSWTATASPEASRATRRGFGFAFRARDFLLVLVSAMSRRRLSFSEQLLVEAEEAIDVRIHRVGVLYAFTQRPPQTRIGRRFLNGSRQAEGIADPEVQSVYPVLDFLGHAADVAADDRPPVEERLLDHQRRVLPPNRRDQDPVGVLHQLRKFLVNIGTPKGDASSEVVVHLGEFLLELLALELEVCAMQPEMGVDFLIDHGHRFKHHL